MDFVDLHPDSVNAIEQLKRRVGNGSKVAFVSGNFNIVHPGHLRLLRFAAECADYLVVGVYDDKIGSGLMPEKLRLEGVEASNWVDFAFILREAPERFILTLRPDVVVKGKEHENNNNPELEALASYGGKLLFGSGDLTFSSIALLKNEFRRLNSSTIVKSNGFLKRHNFGTSDLVEVLEKICQLNVVVIGDAIIDEYVTCEPLGMSQEDPTIVVAPLSRQKFTGAAAIVAAHARGLGANVEFFSVVGKDENSEFLSSQLNEYHVASNLFYDESRPTTSKQRFRADGKTLLRVNQLRQHSISKEIQQQMFESIIAKLEDVDLLIFSDFNYGCLPQPLVDRIVKVCDKRSIMMAADSQSSSQVGDVSRFEGMALLTPTEREARLAVQDFNAGLVVLAERLRKRSRAKNIVLTLGDEGVLVHAEISESNEWLTDRLAAMNSMPKDTSGAGDSLLTCVSMALAAGANIWQSTYLGSLAAACQVGRLGNVPLTTEELRKEILS